MLYGTVVSQEQLHSHLTLYLKAKQNHLLCQQAQQQFETLMFLWSTISILSRYFARKYFIVFCVLLTQGRIRPATLWHCSVPDPRAAVMSCVLWHITEPTRLQKAVQGTAFLVRDPQTMPLEEGILTKELKSSSLRIHKTIPDAHSTSSQSRNVFKTHFMLIFGHRNLLHSELT